MKIKNAFRVGNAYQIATVVAILSAFGCLAVGYYKVTGVLFVVAIMTTYFGYRHLAKLYRRCRRIEQGGGVPDLGWFKTRKS